MQSNVIGRTHHSSNRYSPGMGSIMNGARPPIGQPATLPSILNGYTNGRLDDTVLVRVSVARNLKWNLQSARKLRALTSAAVCANVPLSTTGLYRTFAQQEELLFQRYDRGYIAGRANYRNYEGYVWSLKPGMAQASTPGFSPHGWGMGNDSAVMLAGDTIPDSLRLSDKQWLAANAPRFGLYFPVPGEDWHMQDWFGDTMPQAVLDYEGGVDPVPAFDPASGHFSLYPFDTNKATLTYRLPNMHSDLVAYCQGVLRWRLAYHVVVDGWFGAQTRDFVTWAQATHGLKADGIVGPKTWTWIDSIA